MYVYCEVFFFVFFFIVIFCFLDFIYYLFISLIMTTLRPFYLIYDGCVCGFVAMCSSVYKPNSSSFSLRPAYNALINTMAVVFVVFFSLLLLSKFSKPI